MCSTSTWNVILICGWRRVFSTFLSTQLSNYHTSAFQWLSPPSPHHFPAIDAFFFLFFRLFLFLWKFTFERFSIFMLSAFCSPKLFANYFVIFADCAFFAFKNLCYDGDVINPFRDTHSVRGICFNVDAELCHHSAAQN